MTKSRDVESRALDTLADYIKSGPFKGVLEPEDRRLVLRIIKRLKVNPNRGDINTHLVEASRIIAESHYLVGRYESLRERNDLRATKARSEAERRIRETLREAGERPTVALVESHLADDEAYSKRVQRVQRIKELVRLLQALVKGADARFRALEQVSNNDRIAMRERD